MAESPTRLLIFLSVFILSACALAYEILLMRLFSIVLWHHFAYMIIGLALLGYGVSGTVVSLLQDGLLKRFHVVYPLSILMFAVSSLFCFDLAQHMPFNAELILWDSTQLWRLAVLFTLLSLPFFFAASAICLVFMQYRDLTGQMYAADLTGAGVGSLLVIALLFWLFPQQLLLVISMLPVVAAILPLARGAGRSSRVLLITSLVVAVIVLIFGQRLELEISPYKSMMQTLQIRGARLVEQESNPFGLLSVVENDLVPFRMAPGLSLNTKHRILPQKALFSDADGMSVLTLYPEQTEQLGYLDDMTSALPYHMRKMSSVLVVGGGGGSDVLQARYHQVAEIDVLELNPQVVDLVNDDFAGFTGKLYSQPQVQVFEQDVRGYLESTRRHYSLIQLALVDAVGASSSGLHALNESYLYTCEAIDLYLSRLQPGGYLALTRWVSLPPRDSLKLFNTVVSSLRGSGIEEISGRLLLIRSWQTSTLLVKNGLWTEAELEKLKAFARQRSFDLAWYPGISESEVNRYNKLASADFYLAARALLSTQGQQFVDSYKFDLNPATDDRPYFHHFFKLQTFSELMRLRDRGAMPLMEWGYLILWATLLVSGIVSVVLILLPLWLFGKNGAVKVSSVRWHRVVIYFFTIGIAFLMMEIAFMQKFILFLHHPIYSIALTLSAFLVFAGAGSLSTHYLSGRYPYRTLLNGVCVGIALIGALYLVLLPDLFRLLAVQPTPVKSVVTLLLIAPLAFLMGMPFPLALNSLALHARYYIPWAWGINGCASVISASAATLLAVNLGFSLVILLALLLYLSILWFFPAPEVIKKS
jgi:hypothetical protein